MLGMFRIERRHSSTLQYLQFSGSSLKQVQLCRTSSHFEQTVHIYGRSKSTRITIPSRTARFRFANRRAMLHQLSVQQIMNGKFPCSANSQLQNFHLSSFVFLKTTPESRLITKLKLEIKHNFHDPLFVSSSLSRLSHVLATFDRGINPCKRAPHPQIWDGFKRSDWIYRICLFSFCGMRLDGVGLMDEREVISLVWYLLFFVDYLAGLCYHYWLVVHSFWFFENNLILLLRFL